MENYYERVYHNEKKDSVSSNEDNENGVTDKTSHINYQIPHLVGGCDSVRHDTVALEIFL